MHEKYDLLEFGSAIASLLSAPGNIFYISPELNIKKK